MKMFSRKAVYHLNIHQRKPGKPILLMLHGFMGSSDGFKSLVQYLKPNCNPVTIDLAGHGRSTIEPVPSRFTAESQIRDLQSILDRLQLGNLWLYGYSMGGRLAQNLYIDSPDRFSGLILESTHCGLSSIAERKERQAADEQRASEIETNFNTFINRWTKLPLFNSPEQADSFDYKSILRNQSPEHMAASLRGFGAGAAPYLCNILTKCSDPVVLIAGEEDKIYVDKMREMHHLFPDSSLIVAAKAGHRVHADQPKQIATFLTNFLN